MSAAPCVLLVGPRGRLGRELAPALSSWARVVTAGRGGCDVPADLALPDTLRDALDRVRPVAVVHAAGATHVDAVEQDPGAARAANVTGPAALAEACAARRVTLVHWSSDYVFGSRPGAPYREDDAPGPVNAYGRQKLESELAVRAAGGPHLILRTAWVFARGVPGWLETMATTLRACGEVRAVSDQRGSPTWARSAAQAASRALARWRGVGPVGDLDPAQATGTYHVASRDSATWHEVALALHEHVGRGSVQPITRATRAAAAPRPADTRLDSSHFQQRFGHSLPTWREALSACLAEPPA